MAETPSAEQLAFIGRYDTPTICNAIEIVMPARRAVGFTSEPLIAADPALPPIVGYARTATIRALEPSGLSAAAERERRLAYYEYVAKSPRPTIVVIQDLDPRPGFGAFWGEVQTAVHKGLGVAGAITNGSMRDLGQLAPGFQLLAAKLAPSHAHVHVVELGGQVDVCGMTVRSGELVHADRHGAVVVPVEALAALPAAIERLVRREGLILAPARRPGFDLAKLKQAMADAADIH